MGSVPNHEMLYFSSELVPTCARCGRVRDASGAWHRLEPLPADFSQDLVTHSICPRCLEELYPVFLERRRRQRGPD